MPTYGLRTASDLSGSLGRWVVQNGSNQLQVNALPGTLSLGILKRVYVLGAIQWGEVVAGNDLIDVVTAGPFAVGDPVTNNAAGATVIAAGLDVVSGVADTPSAGVGRAFIQPFSNETGGGGGSGVLGKYWIGHPGTSPVCQYGTIFAGVTAAHADFVADGDPKTCILMAGDWGENVNLPAGVSITSVSGRFAQPIGGVREAMPNIIGSFTVEGTGEVVSTIVAGLMLSGGLDVTGTGQRNVAFHECIVHRNGDGPSVDVTTTNLNSRVFFHNCFLRSSGDVGRYAIEVAANSCRVELNQCVTGDVSNQHAILAAAADVLTIDGGSVVGDCLLDGIAGGPETMAARDCTFFSTNLSPFNLEHGATLHLRGANTIESPINPTFRVLDGTACNLRQEGVTTFSLLADSTCTTTLITTQVMSPRLYPKSATFLGLGPFSYTPDIGFIYVISGAPGTAHVQLPDLATVPDGTQCFYSSAGSAGVVTQFLPNGADKINGVNAPGPASLNVNGLVTANRANATWVIF